MSDESTSFKLDLDAAEFIETALHAKESIAAIGEVESLTALTENLLKAGAVVGILGTAIFAIKESMDLVFDAENIKAINAQFEILSEHAGVYSKTLKEGLVESAHGWADETSLMQAANKAMIQLEGGVEKLPQLMELARKSTAVFGGDLISNFEMMTKAVASGNARHLRHLGLIVDQKKAYSDYAKSIGITVDQLTLAGRQQAILNAAIEKGESAYKGLNPNIKEAQGLWAQFSTTMKEVGETAVIAFDKLAGPTVKNNLSWLGEAAKSTKTWFLDYFGEGAEQAAAHTERLQNKVNDFKVQLIDLEQKKLKGGLMMSPQAYAMEEYRLKHLIDLYGNELTQAQAKSKGFQAEENKGRSPAGGSDDAASNQVDLDKQRLQRVKFNEDILKLKQQLTQGEIAKVEDVKRAEDLYNQKRLQDAKEIDLQIAQVRAQAAAGTGITEAQANQKIILLNQLKKQKLLEDEAEIKKARIAALDNYLNASNSTAQGVTRAFEVGAQKNKMAMADFGKNGQAVFDSFSKHAKTSLMDLGAGTKDATEVMKGFFFDMLADQAEQYGEFMLLSSVWPPNPAGLAGGAGLLALAGFLRGQTSGSTSSAGSSSGISTDSANTGIPINNFGTRTDQAPPVSSFESSRQSVTIQVSGNYFETEQTKMALVDLIRQNQDATDFTISGIGQR